jgi:hypothetical protein
MVEPDGEISKRCATTDATRTAAMISGVAGMAAGAVRLSAA